MHLDRSRSKTTELERESADVDAQIEAEVKQQQVTFSELQRDFRAAEAAEQGN